MKNATDKDKQEQINRGLVNLETSFKQLKNVYAFFNLFEIFDNLTPKKSSGG